MKDCSFSGCSSLATNGMPDTLHGWKNKSHQCGTVRKCVRRTGQSSAKDWPAESTRMGTVWGKMVLYLWNYNREKRCIFWGFSMKGCFLPPCLFFCFTVQPRTWETHKRTWVPGRYSIWLGRVSNRIFKYFKLFRMDPKVDCNKWFFFK